VISSFEVTAVNVVVPTLEEKYNYNFGFHDYKVKNVVTEYLITHNIVGFKQMFSFIKFTTAITHLPCNHILLTD
jgi:hypothetical protein